jgi:hypothetical protein
MAIISKGHTFNAGAIVVASEHNTNLDTLYNDYNGNITNANLSASAGIVDTKLSQITTADKVLGTVITNYFPQCCTMWHDEMTRITGGNLTAPVETNCRYNLKAYQLSADNGDSFSNSFFLKAGTYTFSFLGNTGAISGKINWYIDDMVTPVIVGQDWYNGSVVYNVIQTATVTVVGDGYHKLKGKVNGKNVSSAGYYISLISYWLKLTTDGLRE